MANVIDSLIVTLGLDPKAFKKGAKEVQDTLDKTGKSVKKPAQELEDLGKKGAESMAKFRNEVLRTAAALVGMSAIKSFVASVTRSDAALGRTAKNLDMNVGALSNWQLAAKMTGGTAEGMTGDFKGLANTIQSFGSGMGGEAMKFFRAFHIDTAKNGKMRDLGDIMLDLSDAFQKIDPAKAQMLGRQMGLSEDTVNLIMKGRKAVQDYLDTAKKINERTPADTAAAQERQTAWVKLTETFDRLATDVLNAVSPALVGLMDFIRDNAGTSAALLGAVALAMTSMSLARFGGVIASLGELSTAIGGAAGASGTLMALLGRMGLLGAVGLGAYGIARAILGATGATDAMGDLGAWDATHDDPDMKGGYVEGTIKGLGNRGRGALPRGIRNNNPGNLEFAGQAGASREQGGGGRFAAFSSMAEGLAALAGQLQRYAGRGDDTVSKIISKYAPAGENNTAAYIASVAKKLGVGSSDHLNLKDPNVLRELMAGITTFENGSGRVSLAQLNSGIDLYRQRGMGGGMAGGDTNSSETHIGTIVIKTAATDAQGIHRDLRSTLKRQNLALAANQGLAS